MAWVPYWDHEAAWASFRQHKGEIDAVGLFWYVLLRNGSIGRYPHAIEDPALITEAQKNHVRVFAVIANLPTEDEKGDWDPVRVEKVTGTAAARKKHIANILAIVRKHGFDGVNIDYEALKARQRDAFSRFSEELAAALHKEGKLLGISLHPKMEEGNPRFSNGSEAQEWRRLARVADHLYVMTYGEHWETSSPGPIASSQWMEDVLRYARTQIPEGKLYAGVPLYGFDWSRGPAKGLTYGVVWRLLKTYASRIQWNSSAQESSFTYRQDGVTHTVWFEDRRSVNAKLGHLRRLGISRVALWRLGSEDPAVWNAIHQWKTPRP